MALPLLAPLLGSLAGSLLPATFGTGVATALGASGVAGGLLAAAAPKALGAGIGTLLAGGDLGDAALNAVGFGAAGGALSSMMAGSPGAAGTTGASTAAPAAAPGPMDAIKAITEAVGQGQQGQSPMQMFGGQPPAPYSPQQQGQSPMQMFGGQPPAGTEQVSAPMEAVTDIASRGIASVPAMGGQPMSMDMMRAGMPPEVGSYLNAQGMRGFV